MRRLGDAALGAFLEDGTAAVTVDQIVDAAGMAKGSFYRYARDKADLVEQIMAPVMAEATTALDRCEVALRGARRDMIAAIYLQLATELAAVVARHPPRVLLYLQEVRAPASAERRAIHDFADQLMHRTAALTTIARDHGLIRDVDPELSALTVVGAVDTILFAHLRRRSVSTRATPVVIAQLVELVLRGIATAG